MTAIDDDTLFDALDAAQEGNVEKMKALFAKFPGLGRESPPTSDGSWLIVAASKGHVELIRYLVGCGLSLNSTNRSGECALSKIARLGDVRAARWMIQQGADPNISKWPIIDAVSTGNLDIVKLFVEHGADYNLVFGRPPRTPLSQAIAFGHAPVADYLRLLGAVLPPSHEELDDENVIDAEGVDEPGSAGDEVKEYFSHVTGNNQHANGLQEIVPGNVNISVWTIPPKQPGDMMILFTTGLSDLPMTVPAGSEGFRYAELAMQLPGDWPFPPKMDDETQLWPWMWLRKIAQYAHDAETWLGDGETTFANDDPPKPLAPGIQFTAFLLYPDVPGSYTGFTADDGRRIHIYSLMPIYTEECTFAKKQGFRELFKRFAKHGIGLSCRPGRPNVAK
jgi:ankyrin repeat protein